jgi:hypothetical protein
VIEEPTLSLLRKLDIIGMFKSEKDIASLLYDLMILCQYFKGGIAAID